MKTFLLWAATVLALEVLVVWGYFALVDGIAGGNAVLVLLVGTVLVVMWLGFNRGFGPTLKRLLLAVLVCVIGTYAVLVVAGPLLDLPTALVCERGRTDVETTPTIEGGRFEEYRVGPCVFYNPESRPLAGGAPAD
jgi:hypothetical protein